MTVDHLTFDVLRYPGSSYRPGDPDGAWFLRFFLGDQLLVGRGRRPAYCSAASAAYCW
ncbi:hypothetical protein SLNWT_6176 [Streptomyces albus]|uniref:Uncharacterized protein n=1 Tax=Streptomyces albus (strain ATCC 21838 / DSM 41398 / FERM P-419 / JCM 4703 / NBRC 107858) TaxID=1081613 RepID=A0A0B5F7V5_STRA4|nr:hypothetical protein SLNWT_6176 [Streptomyces albus]AOU80856.1 hypothetical protein SLNHY_6165 [Streptomyces albus]